MKSYNKRVGGGKIRAIDLCYIALFTALIAVCGMICIPVGNVKYTLQLLGVLLTAGVLGWKRALLAVGVYLSLGALGVPVFAGFSGGLITAPTGGYLVGFLLTAFVAGLGYEIEYKNQDKIKAYWLNFLIGFAFSALGVVLCYVVGTVWFLISMGGNDGVTLTSALVTCVLPYLVVDVVKIIVSLLVIPRLRGFIR